jgi:hypothetical protein
MVRALVVLLLLCSASSAGQRDLTVDEVRYLIAASGFNPGTIKQIGELGQYQLKSVLVEGGKQHGEYLIRIQVTPIRNN